MTFEHDNFEQARRNLEKSILSGKILESADKACVAYDVGTRDMFRYGLGGKAGGVLLSAFSPVLIPIVVASSVLGAGLSRIGEKVISQKNIK